MNNTKNKVHHNVRDVAIYQVSQVGHFYIHDKILKQVGNQLNNPILHQLITSIKNKLIEIYE
jgi:hypothetical protein